MPGTITQVAKGTMASTKAVTALPQQQMTHTMYGQKQVPIPRQGQPLVIGQLGQLGRTAMGQLGQLGRTFSDTRISQLLQDFNQKTNISNSNYRKLRRAN